MSDHVAIELLDSDTTVKFTDIAKRVIYFDATYKDSIIISIARSNESFAQVQLTFEEFAELSVSIMSMQQGAY